MANLNFFLGKIPNPKDNQNLQLQGKYYEADKKWFNGLQPGDYVFIISDKKVLFWKAMKWQTVKGHNRMVFQELVNDCGIKPIQFSALNYFNLDINNTVKATRSTAKEEKGFFPLSLDSNNSINVNNLSIQTADLRKVVLYSSLAEAHKDKNAAGDIQIYLDNTEFKIINKSFIHWNKPFISNPAPSGKNKIKTLAKFKLSSGTSKKVINVSIRDFYDLFFSNLVPTNKRVVTTPPSGGNLTTNNKQSLNLILYGPPGTGKTYNSVNKALEILLGETAYAAFETNAKTQSKFNTKVEREFYTKEFNKLKDKGRIVFTTFHQSMGYEGFVEGIKPETNKKTKQVIYDVKNGILKELCYNIIKENINPVDRTKVSDEQVEEFIREKQFIANKGKQNILDRYVLIIDEINRGNVSQIFGELITLIEKDKRLGEDEVLTVKLPYSHKEFGVPNNLYIIGTMNTADRSVEALDTALRRRFSFEEIMPKPDKLKGISILVGTSSIDIEKLFTNINERLLVLKDREHQIGHSYFMNVDSVEKLKAVFFDKIIPLLQEYFYGDYEKILMVLGDGFVTQEKKDYVKLFAGRGDFDTLPDTIFSIVDKGSMSENEFEAALLTLMK